MSGRNSRHSFTSAAIVAACDQPGTTCTGTPACSSSAMRAGSVRRLRRSTSSGSMSGLPSPAWVSAIATCVAPPENPPVTKWSTRTGRASEVAVSACMARSLPARAGIIPRMSQPLPLSGVVITKNEADRIARCVGSMVGLCSEVIVLDSGSTDDTVRIAHQLGARVEQLDWQGFALQKNAAIAMAREKWVLLLDADEWLEPAAQEEVRKLFAGDIEQSDVWLLMRRTHFLGHALRGGSFAREPVHRLFRSNIRHGLRAVHEYLDVEGRVVKP